jgi:hypothetical protein
MEADARRCAGLGKTGRLNCEVRATKNTDDADPSAPPVLSEIRVTESDAISKLPDGDYQLLVDGKLVHVKREDGCFTVLS